jgi:hypothetical protein
MAKVYSAADVFVTKCPAGSEESVRNDIKEYLISKVTNKFFGMSFHDGILFLNNKYLKTGKEAYCFDSFFKS